MLLWKNNVRFHLLKWKTEILFFIFWILYFAFFWSKALFFDASGNLVAGHVNIWGDWAAHFTMVTQIANRDNWLLSSPLLIGTPLQYPYLANWLAAQCVKLGAPLIGTMVTLSFITSIATICAVWWWFLTLFKKRGRALIATLLFLLNGGLGFIYFAQDVLQSNTPLLTALNPLHEYTRIDSQNIKWISIIDSMIIPQRSFGLGFPIALFSLTTIYSTLLNKSGKKLNIFQKKLLIFSGVCIGFLPLMHTHSFLALFIILSCWAMYSILSTKSAPIFMQWASLGLLITGIFFAIYNTIFFAPTTTNGIKIALGWLASELEVPIVWFWIQNWGLMPFCALLGLIFSWFKLRKTFYILFPFVALFFGANIVQLQPHLWDNTKILVWASLGIVALSTIVLQELWEKQHRALVVILFLLFTASGILDLHWIARHDLHSHIMYSKEEIELSEWTKNNTPKTSIWLTGDQHNHWLFTLTGRQSLMTYRGWQWTHSLPYKPIEADISRMFSHPKIYQSLFAQYGVTHIVVGTNEISVWNANEAELASLFTKIHETPSYRIYKISQ